MVVVPHISQISRIPRQISHKCPTYQDKYPKSHIFADLCLIFSTDLAHGDSVKDAEPENAKVSQVLPTRVKSTCHWLSLSAAAKVLFIEILDFAKSWWAFWQLWQTEDISDFIGVRRVYERFDESSRKHFKEDFLFLLFFCEHNFHLGGFVSSILAQGVFWIFHPN